VLRLNTLVAWSLQRPRQRRRVDLRGLEAVVRARASRCSQRSAAACCWCKVKQRHLAVQQVGDVGDGGLEPIHRERHVSAVEVPTVQDLVGLGVDDGVVVDAVDLRLQERLERRQRVHQHADDVRRAAQRVPILNPILDPVPAGRRGAPTAGGVLEIVAHPARAGGLARVRLEREDSLVEVRGSRAATAGHRRQRRPGAPAAAAPVEARRPVIMLVPFISARLSLGSSATGARPVAASASAAGTTRPSKETSRSPISAAATYDSGVRSPLAPTDPSEGMRGRMRRLSRSASRSRTTGRTPE
jgi:hypothetical protein